MDTYDNRLYAVGKGQSALTIAKSQVVVEEGSAVTIQGSVMDVSPGCLTDTNLAIRFPNGVPAVSDASMSNWMLYVWKDFERPADATGVNVRIEAINPNGEYEDWGTTTSDAYGNWAFGACPDTAGTYMIIATFSGSGAYYGSTDTAYLTVAEAVEPDTTGIQESVNNVENTVSGLTTYLLAILVLVIIALLVAIYSVLKK
jgi:hypothetical protein